VGAGVGVEPDVEGVLPQAANTNASSILQAITRLLALILKNPGKGIKFPPIYIFPVLFFEYHGIVIERFNKGNGNKKSLRDLSMQAQRVHRF